MGPKPLEAPAVRLERQMMLPEIGLAGQARIAATSARVPLATDGLVGLVASRYAGRAGFAGLAPGAAEEVPTFVRHPSARQVVAGSLAALREVRLAVFGGAA